MNIEFRSDKAVISGYVNCVERESRPLQGTTGKFIEVIKQGAFKRSLEQRPSVDLLLNHDTSRLLGSTSAGTLELIEDNIGLKATATITDGEVIEKLRNNKISGWSFGFKLIDDFIKPKLNGISKRYVKALELFEVSLIDETMTPAYASTSVELRNNAECLIEYRYDTNNSIEENIPDPDAEKYNEFLRKIKGGL